MGYLDSSSQQGLAVPKSGGSLSSNSCLAFTHTHKKMLSHKESFCVKYILACCIKNYCLPLFSLPWIISWRHTLGASASTITNWGMTDLPFLWWCLYIIIIIIKLYNSLPLKFLEMLKTYLALPYFWDWPTLGFYCANLVPKLCRNLKYVICSLDGFSYLVSHPERLF